MLVFVQSTNFCRGETTLERYGKKLRRPKINLIESPKRKYNIDYSMIEQLPEERNCPANCFDMVCVTGTKTQQQILYETKLAYQGSASELR